MVSLLSIVLLADAQDSSRHSPAADSTITATVVRNGRFSSVLYTCNGMPLTKNGIEQRLLRYPDAALELQKYKQNRHATLFWGCLCVASSIAAAIEYNQHNIGASHVFIGVSVSGLLAELLVGAHSASRWGRAIEVYNGHFQ
ncbi:MAG TPA: hypothetical protein VLD19_06500 [Chitinophagaceae bacterium]|nr:hypothetical protein [Chitinophagaceae bacterium]